jgi:DinB superfamily
MDTADFVNEDLKWAHELFRMTIADITPQLAGWIPPGIANPLGATYAHAVCTEDAVFQIFIKGNSPLFLSTWAERTGISEPRMRADLEWARDLKVDLALLKHYRDAVFSKTEAYLETVSGDELIRQLDLSKYGFGERTVAWIFQALVIGHLNNMTGEISCLKGLQGAVGYPF